MKKQSNSRQSDQSALLVQPMSVRCDGLHNRKKPHKSVSTKAGDKKLSRIVTQTNNKAAAGAHVSGDPWLRCLHTDVQERSA